MADPVWSDLGEPRKILIRAVNWVGDAVLTLPAILAVARRFPRTEITLLAKPWVAPLLAGQPGVDRVLTYETPGRHAGLRGRLALSAELRAERFDLALLLPNSLDTAVPGWLAGIPRRAGHATDGRSLLLTDRLRPRREPGRHQVEYYLDLARALGGDADPLPRLLLSRQAVRMAETLLGEHGMGPTEPCVGVNPGSVYGSAKRWPAACFAAAADALEERLGARTILFGSGREMEILTDVASRMRRPGLVLGGRTDLGVLAALLRRCRLLLSNDTGAMHVAAAVGTPTLAVFGPTDPVATAPLGGRCRIVRSPVPCSPCLLRECPIDHRCMRLVAVGDVLRAAEELLAGPGGRVASPTGEGAVRGKPCAFLDRDGTIIEDPGYLSDPDGIRFIPGAIEAVRRLRAAGYLVVGLTNQAGVARGLYGEREVRLVNDRLQQLLTDAGAPLDAIYYCPHHADYGSPEYRKSCECRKPGPGMVTQALRDFSIDLDRSVIVGDHLSDVEVRKHVPGLRGVLLLTGHGAEQRDRLAAGQGPRPDHVAADLAEAATWILGGAHAAFS
jgi:heptosyltransferase-2